MNYAATTPPRTTKNIIAHELGHALGLEHQRNPTALMCLPCRPIAHAPPGLSFLPLTDVDRQRLTDLYGTASD